MSLLHNTYSSKSTTPAVPLKQQHEWLLCKLISQRWEYQTASYQSQLLVDILLDPCKLPGVNYVSEVVTEVKATKILLHHIPDLSYHMFNNLQQEQNPACGSTEISLSRRGLPAEITSNNSFSLEDKSPFLGADMLVFNSSQTHCNNTNKTQKS